MSIDYAWERLYIAVRTLATSHDSLRERLRYAMTDMAFVAWSDFPEGDLRKRWTGIYEDLTIFEPRNSGEGKIEATTAQLSEHDAGAIAERIFDLFMEIQPLVTRQR